MATIPTLLIDFGNSKTRVRLMTEKWVYCYELPNNFAELPDDYKIANIYSNPFSNFFEFNAVRFANGAVVDREFRKQAHRPTSLRPKAQQLTTKLTFTLACIRAFEILDARSLRDLSSQGLELNVALLVPPNEKLTGEQAMVEVIQSVKKIKSQSPLEIEAPLVVREVRVEAEAVAALFGAMYYEPERVAWVPETKEDQLPYGVTAFSNTQAFLDEVPDNKRFLEGYGLVLDIGAGTTDVALFLDNELVQSSGRTFKDGGNKVEASVKFAIQKKHGFEPYDMRQVVATGLAIEGDDKPKEVADLVTQAKKEYASVTLGNLREYFEELGIEGRLLRYMLIAGGGGLPSMRVATPAVYAAQTEEERRKKQAPAVVTPATYVEVSPPMSKILKEFVEELSPTIANMSLGGKPARDLNIEGLYFLQKY